ncbi:nucleotidyltransferase domain-containing protein [Mangrovibacterium marinum]|uniref:Nucleotidyltransferase-like protein n=1 Tax=Mangrovibacterium marinum TaxID=1639118 RepID=A0A2T5C463_9BACT|nr:nucleotidyltransferase domain-containing protein [Mangrovibacterium marinum]PTN09574.1 nucleotidyltransferase-like protein [Mangrovibacterium marinum]
MNKDLNVGLSSEDLERIVRIIKQCSKVDEVILFGSRAKGTFTNGSDIDIALKGDHILRDDVLDLLIDLEALNLPYKFDLVVFNRIEEDALIAHISSVGISL